MAKSPKTSDIDSVEPHNLTLSQESELNSKAAAAEGFIERMAFEQYYKMGDNRSIRKIATDLHKHRNTVQDWSQKYRWQARVKERERQAAEFLIMQQSAQEEAETKKKHLTLIDAGISTFARNLAQGKVEITSIDDLQKLVKMRWMLANMPDKRVNPIAAASKGGGSIDLRLRNMEKSELQSFLFSTLQSMQRVLNKAPKTDAQCEKDLEQINKDDETFDLNISLSKKSNDNIQPNISESELSAVSDFNLDLNLDD